MCTSTASGIPLIEPGTQFDRRRAQLDLRLSKIVRFGSKVRLQGNVDLFNVLNGSAATIVTTYGPLWRQPITMQEARLLTFGGQLTF